MSEPTWKTYQDVAIYLLNEMAAAFDLERVEGPQSLLGLRSGTSYCVDGKGIRIGNGAVIIIECRRRTTSRQSQEAVGAIAYRILDTGAVGGIVVSPLGLQEGGEKVARAEKIIDVHLDENSTTTEYLMAFLNKVFAAATDNLMLHERASVVTRDVITGQERRLEWE